MQTGSPFPSNLLVQKGKERPELNCLPVEPQFQQKCFLSQNHKPATPKFLSLKAALVTLILTCQS